MRDFGDQRYLAYIRDSIELIEARTRRGRDSFLADIDGLDAVLWRLQTLAEATGKLSSEVKSRHPAIRWRAIYGFRNIAAHAYFELRHDVIWEIIDQHLPLLKAAIEEELLR